MSSAVATTGGGSAGKGKGVAASEAKKKIDASGKTTMAAKLKSTKVVEKSEVNISFSAKNCDLVWEFVRSVSSCLIDLLNGRFALTDWFWIWILSKITFPLYIVGINS